MRFSSKYKTFKEWLKAGNRTSRYAKRIINAHRINPTATLKEIRIGKAIINSLISTPLEKYTPKQRKEQVWALEVLRKMRKDKLSFTEAVKRSKLSKKKVLQYLGQNIYKKGKFWRATKTDNLQRAIIIFSNGERKSIIVGNSRDASLIGDYFDAVSNLTENHDPTKLKQFEGIKITDKDGNSYYFETDPNEVFKILEMMKDFEFFEIYDDKY